MNFRLVFLRSRLKALLKRDDRIVYRNRRSGVTPRRKKRLLALEHKIDKVIEKLGDDYTFQGMDVPQGGEHDKSSDRIGD